MKTLDENTARLQSVLTTERFGRTCRWYDTLGSTNSLAMTWAEEGAATGAVVVADFQEKGRGRFNRSWTADPGTNLTFSTIVRPLDLRPQLELLPVGVAIAVAETLSDVTEPHQPQIKWPNDVLLTGRKVCGILIESQLSSRSDDQAGRIVVGIGINVNQEKFPDEIAETATSLYRVLGRQVDRIELLAGILASMESACDDIGAGRIGDLVERFESRMIGIGATVRFTQMDAARSSEGTILGLDESGGLRIRTTAGIVVLRAGEVTIRTEAVLPQTRIARLPDQPFSTKS